MSGMQSTPLACGPGHPEWSWSYLDIASRYITFTCTLQLFTFTYVLEGPF